MKMKTTLVWFCGAVVGAAVVWFNYTHLVEAYGSGPPYYGRTTNMDKWTNPIPILVVIDVIAVVLLVILFRLGLDKARGK
ncbi:MAG: hypothetical protein L0226_00095 [Acidobacteria bacterium]|nr:hypothetical protein [Acidobacteriota bacterium]MCI0590137.1 hypothetical protein [Gammaproteobacteria bacterium]